MMHTELPRNDGSRRAGLLLHPTSLPGAHGVGDLGDAALEFLDQLVVAKTTLWQILPLGPVGWGYSPYAARSAFAGNPHLIALDRVVADGLLPSDECDAVPIAQGSAVDWSVADQKLRALRVVADQFATRATTSQANDFALFCETEAHWLDDWALFAALAEAHPGVPWTRWDAPLARRDPSALKAWSAAHAREIHYHRVVQWLVFRQWRAVHRAANERGVRILGDIPIFVAHDSADVWANRDLFALDSVGNPVVVAGVPPDYFSATGQRWGNPLYRWDVIAQRNYEWWVRRMRHTLAMVDEVRIDHFRGFVAYWEIPASEPTAVNGRWVPGPGQAFFDALRRQLGDLAIVVEDLGVITPDVVALRDRLGYPGMQVLQFAFSGGPQNPYLPFHYDRNTVVYTGTHDNDTTAGWYANTTEEERDAARRYMGVDGHDISWDLIRLALSSVANTAVAPVQDLLKLGSDARLNLPGAAEGNWGWRLTPGQLDASALERFGDLVARFGRVTTPHSAAPPQRRAEVAPTAS